MPIVLKSGSLNLLEPSGPVQACNGTALPLLNSVVLLVLVVRREENVKLYHFRRIISYCFDLLGQVSVKAQSIDLFQKHRDVTQCAVYILYTFNVTYLTCNSRLHSKKV